MKLSLSTSFLLACLVLQSAEESHAFAVLRQPHNNKNNNNNNRVHHTRRGDPPSLQVAAEYETVSDVQKAVDWMDSLEGDYDHTDQDTVVRVRNELHGDDDCAERMPSKKDLVKDVQEMMDAEPLVVLLPDNHTEEEESLVDKGLNLASELGKLLQFDDAIPEAEEKTDEQAAVSASLYMNPATAKIARHVKITWEPDVAETLSRLCAVSNPKRPFMVGIVGIPGSGKSTSAEIIQAILGEERALIMPMDGFHIPLAELAEQENAADAIYRRGAPDTFHAAALKDELARIAYSSQRTVTIPGFDHAVGDPTPNQHKFDRNVHRIVLCEGLYLLHDDDGWEGIQSFFDWTIYIDANVDVCIDRLKERNKCIPGYTPEEIEIRCDEVDRKNAETARDGAYKYASQIVASGASS